MLKIPLSNGLFAKTTVRFVDSARISLAVYYVKWKECWVTQAVHQSGAFFLIFALVLLCSFCLTAGCMGR